MGRVREGSIWTPHLSNQNVVDHQWLGAKVGRNIFTQPIEGDPRDSQAHGTPFMVSGTHTSGFPYLQRFENESGMIRDCMGPAYHKGVLCAWESLKIPLNPPWGSKPSLPTKTWRRLRRLILCPNKKTNQNPPAISSLYPPLGEIYRWQNQTQGVHRCFLGWISMELSM